MRSGGDRSAALRNRISKGIKEQEPKSVFEVENTSGNSPSTSPNCAMTEGVQPGSCKSNAISRRWGGRRAQTHKNEERWSEFNRLSSVGEVAVTAVPASPVSGERLTAKTWSSVNWPWWDSETSVTCRKALSGTLKSGAWATPTRSPGSRSATPCLLYTSPSPRD